MGGQDGFSRTLLRYTDESTTLTGGMRFHPGDRWTMGVSLGWTSSEAGLDPFDLSADDYVETHPTMSFDFSRSHTYSALDSTRLDGDLHVTCDLKDDFWIRFSYQYVDWQDDAPYLLDTNGTVQWATVALGWEF